MNCRYSWFDTRVELMLYAGRWTGCAHFSLSKTNSWAGELPNWNVASSKCNSRCGVDICCDAGSDARARIGGAVNPSVCRAVSYTHLRAHETVLDLVCRLLLEKKK